MATPDITVQVKGGKTTVISSPTGSATRLDQLADVTATPRANGDVLTYISANGKYEFHAPTGGSGGSANAFGTVNVAGQNNIVANATSNTLIVVAGTGIVLTTDNVNSSITIAATGGASFDQFARDQANGAFDKANAAYSNANTAIYTAGQIRANISNTAPINYDPVTGIISHALSEVTPTTYGNTTFVPTITVDNKGHITSVVNTAIALPPSTDEFARAQANSAFIKANGAYAQANIATTNADAAFVQANAGFTLATTANTVAASAYAQANIATTNADAAFLQANNAYDYANTIQAIAVASGAGRNYYLDPNLSQTGNNYSLRVFPSVNSEVTLGTTVNANTRLIARFVANIALGTTSIDAGEWVTKTWANVSLVSGTSEILTRINKRVYQTGTVTATGTGASRTFTTYGTSPFNPSDASADILVATVLATPNETFYITSYTSSAQVDATHQHGDTGYINEDNVAFTLAYLLFPALTTGDINATASPELFSNTSVQPAFSCNTTDRIVSAYFAQTTSTSDKTLTIFIGGSSHYSYIQTPLSLRHNQLLGVQGGTADEYYHLTATEYSKLDGSYATANGAFAQANIATTNADAAFARANAAYSNANTAIYTAGQIRANISNTAPIRYDSTTGIVSHATSGVTATGYGDSSHIPVFVVDDKGHVTSVSNVAIDTGVGATDAWARDQANAAFNQANTANVTGQAAYNQANAGFTLATTANTVAASAYAQANIATTNADAAFARANAAFSNANTAIYTASQIRANISNTSPILYNVTTGAVSLLAPTANGQLLIGNTVSGNYDLNTLTQGTGILITNDKGSITIAATGGSAVDDFARAHANGAFDQANAANVLAQTARNHANGAYVQANIATTNADAAFLQANAGFTLATTANTVAASAYAQANAGFSLATTANTVAASAYAQANIATTNADAAFARANAAYSNANTAIYTAGQIRANISNTAPVNYDPSTGIISHATSGVAATTYGNASFVPTTTINDKGHVTSVTNTAIALDASAIISGTLTVARGGTGQTTYANGDLLIGNTMSGGLDKANLTQGYGIIITNTAGNIKVDAATGRTYYLILSQASDIPTYNVALQTPSSGAEVNTSAIYTGTSYSLVTVFATAVGDPGTSLLPAGTYGRHYHATTDGVNNDAQIRVDLYKYAANTLETLLRSNESPIFNSGDASAVLLNWNVTDSSSYELAETDRLVWKVYVRRVSGGSGSVRVTLFYEGSSQASYFPTTILAAGADVFARTQANAAFARANAAYSNANTAIYTAGQIRANISNTAPVNYDPSTGIISHAASGVTATTYGNATFISQITVDSRGHLTSASNIAIDQSLAQTARDQANAAFNQANTANTVAASAYTQANIATTNADAAFAKANSAVLTAAQIRANISNTAPVNYDPSTGIISHAASGVTATTYGSSALIPVITVDANGHITAASNAAVAGLPAATANGQTLIGNTVSGSFDVALIAQTAPVIVTNGKGTITLSHASSGVTATGYGTSSQIPVFVVDTFGHITGVTNTAIAITTASVSEAAGGPFYHTAARVRGNVTNTTPINYDASTGIFSHALSGVSATGYGDAATIPKVVVDDKGHVTSVTNTAIAIAATQITSGTLVQARGGTGYTGSSANGQTLIGNTVSGGFDLATLTAGTGIAINNLKGSIEIVSLGGSATDQFARDTANGAFLQANIATTNADAAFARANAAYSNANTAIYTASQIRANISNTAPINYDPTTGIISHALSGVSATGYGDGATIPVFVVDDKGHVTSVTNTAVAIGASQITTGTLIVNRGGTGQTATSLVNGAVLIGNTVSGGYDLNTLTQGSGILITNDKGSITIASTSTGGNSFGIIQVFDSTGTAVGNVYAEGANTSLKILAGNNVTLTSDDATNAVTISVQTGIMYAAMQGYLTPY